MTKVTVRVDGLPELKAALDALGSRARGALRQAALSGAEVLRTEAARRAPGPHIGKELQERGTVSAQVAIGPDSEHWYYQFAETGAAPHEIDGEMKKALQFLGKTELMVRRSVHHTGMAANPFLRPAMDAGKDGAVAAVRVVLKRAVE